MVLNMDLIMAIDMDWI
jgi:hypothetical protein